MSAPIRILELRSARGSGGGPDKTILAGAAASDPSRYAVTVCYLRDGRDETFSIGTHAAAMKIDFTAVPERHSFDWAVWPALRRLVVERGIDIVHSHDYKTDLLALLLAWRTGAIPLATVHNWCGLTARERLLYYPADKYLLRAFPLVIVVSRQIREELERCRVRPERILTLLNGVDVVKFRRDSAVAASARAELGVAPEHVVIGAVGRLESEKRYDVLIDAVAALRNRFPLLRLALVGEGSWRPRLEALVAQHGLQKRCTLLGYRRDVVRISQAFDLFIQSSDDEGTSNALLEAMALEIPIVATDVGGTSELITSDVHALLVRPGDVSALASAVEQTVAHPASTRARVRAARERVEGPLSFAARNRALEAIYERLIASRASRTGRALAMRSA
ncbi:MAG TPA: glycosyltransferase [Vicinamibacterales bacterium]|nr:glycosyltransferase [Vicinamibacterales bacterium]